MTVRGAVHASKIEVPESGKTFAIEGKVAEGDAIEVTGIITPPPEYLTIAARILHEHGALLIVDEVQTGMHRTGPFLAAHHFGVEPDMVVMAKAMSGGLVPVSAVLMTNEIYDSVYGSLRRAIVHTSTYSENSLAMRAALATLDVLESEELGARAQRVGEKAAKVHGDADPLAGLLDRLREQFAALEGQARCGDVAALADCRTATRGG